MVAVADNGKAFVDDEENSRLSSTLIAALAAQLNATLKRWHEAVVGNTVEAFFARTQP
tara:strand:- start:7236 stop:7409 length:174 start_codon:yes stop_codon:yes gene_type:complete